MKFKNPLKTLLNVQSPEAVAQFCSELGITPEQRQTASLLGYAAIAVVIMTCGVGAYGFFNPRPF